MGFFDALLHPRDFLGLTDLRMGTMILAGVNFVLIAANFGAAANSWRAFVNTVFAVIALICTALGCYGAFKNNAQHVTYYFYYCFVNLIFAIVNCIMYILSVAVWAVCINIIYLLIATYTLAIVNGFLSELGGGGNTAANAV